MCKWGTSTAVWCKRLGQETPPHLNPTDWPEAWRHDRWRDEEIDSCIAPLVQALQEAGIDMMGSCCGHGRVEGEILLADGRTLVVRVADEKESDYRG